MSDSVLPCNFNARLVELKARDERIQRQNIIDALRRYAVEKETRVFSKLTVDGNIFDYRVYERPLKYARATGVGKKQTFDTIPVLAPNHEEKNARDSHIRAKKRLIQLVNLNCQDLSKFLTLTYADDIRDIKQANYDFSLFIKRMRYHFKHFEYIAVPEKQNKTRDGVIHYHLLCFSINRNGKNVFLPWKEVSDVWGKGYTFIKKCSSIDQLGAYIAKYMGKDFQDRKSHSQRFLYSSGILKRGIVTVNSNADKLVNDTRRFFTKVNDFTLNTQHYGKLHIQTGTLPRKLLFGKRTPESLLPLKSSFLRMNVERHLTQEELDRDMNMKLLLLNAFQS